MLVVYFFNILEINRIKLFIIITFGLTFHIVIDYNIATEDGTYYEVNSGFFKVLSNGLNYELEFEGTTIDGKVFSGYYKGSLFSY